MDPFGEQVFSVVGWRRTGTIVIVTSEEDVARSSDTNDVRFCWVLVEPHSTLIVGVCEVESRS